MGLLDLLFPKICSGCNRWGSYLCQECIKEIKQGELVCPTCERPSIGGFVHPLCKRRYKLDGLWSLGVYEGSLRNIIQKLKYKFVTEAVEVLVNLLIEYWAKFGTSFIEEIRKDQGRGWLVVPVPLHPKRQRERGFNQSALLGKMIAQKLGLGYLEALKRVKHTKPQVGLESWQRKKNIKNAFSVDTKYNIQNTSILLIDDVWTTGSTLKECCFFLKKGGAKKVWATTLAR